MEKELTFELKDGGLVCTNVHLEGKMILSKGSKIEFKDNMTEEQELIARELREIIGEIKPANTIARHNLRKIFREFDEFIITEDPRKLKTKTFDMNWIDIPSMDIYTYNHLIFSLKALNYNIEY